MANELVVRRTMRTYSETGSVVTCLSAFYEQLLAVIVALVSSRYRRIHGFWSEREILEEGYPGRKLQEGEWLAERIPQRGYNVKRIPDPEVC